MSFLASTQCFQCLITLNTLLLFIFLIYTEHIKQTYLIVWLNMWREKMNIKTYETNISSAKQQNEENKTFLIVHNIVTVIIMFSLIDNLINNMEQFDGKLVTIESETIGEAMNRGGYSWINVNDGTNAIGIWLKSSDSARIITFGDYKQIGDTVLISGIFSGNSGKHAGEVEIDSSSLKIVREGHAVKEHLTHIKIFSATLLFLLCAYIFVYLHQSNTKK